jgi:hypothetical protein
MQVIIFSNSNGGVSTCIPTGEISIEAVLAKDCPTGALIVEASSLPNDDSDFYNAWELANGVVTVNLDKAKEITKARLRTEREPLLAAQDVLYMRAIESNADTTAIVAEKQRLRDVTGLVDTCTTTAELRALEV